MSGENSDKLAKALAAGRVVIHPIPKPYPRPDIRWVPSVPGSGHMGSDHPDWDKLWTVPYSEDGVRYTAHNVPLHPTTLGPLYNLNAPGVVITAEWEDGRDA